MASSSSSSYKYLLLLFVLALIVSPTFISSADLISDICSKTNDPTYCFKFVKPLYQQGTTTPIDFANAVIQASKTVLYLVYEDILYREMQTSKSNPLLSSQYKECEYQYEYAVSVLNRCQSISDLTNSKKLMIDLSLTALREIRSCDLNFIPIGSEPPDFKTLHQNSINVCDIVLSLTHTLAAGENYFFGYDHIKEPAGVN